ncbi:MAG TPA: hypothetical protein VMT72_15150 [Pseudolabrys sp.]|nr:hypothetical protein [Pseudolabrys sp.]
MDKIRDIFSYFVAAMAMFALLGAVYQAFNNQKGSALTLGTLFLVGALIVFLPQVEIIKTLGVEARLRQTVTEAVATLANLKRLAQISARSSYLTIAWGNRLGTPSAKEKQAVLDGIDGQLEDLKITPAERAVIVGPWVRLIKADFFYIFTQTTRKFATIKAGDLRDKIHATQSQEAHDASHKHSDLITPWSKRTDEIRFFERLDGETLGALIDDYLPKSGEWLTDKELAAFQRLKAEIVRLNADCEKKGGFTAEAAEFYDKYAEDQKDKAQEVWDRSRG